MDTNKTDNFNFTALFDVAESQNARVVLHEIFNGMHHGIAIAKASGEIIYLNNNFANHFALDLDESAQQTMERILNRIELTNSPSAVSVQEILKFPKKGKKKLKVKSQTGTILDLLISKISWQKNSYCYLLESTPYHDPIDQIDDSGLKVYQHLQSLIAEAPFGVEIYNKSGVLIHVNKAWEHIWEFKADDVINNFNLKDEYKKSSLYKYIERVLAGETVIIPEMMMSRKFGARCSEQKWIRQRAFPIKNSRGDVEQIIITQEDITYQKQTEFARRFSEYEFRVIWEKSPLGMRLTDEEGIIQRVNPAFCELVEMSDEELLGKPLSIVYKKDVQHHILEMHRKRFRERTVETHFEKEVEFWNGKKRWLEVSNSFFAQLNGKTLLLGIFRDVSLRKTYEMALNRERQYFESLFQNSPEAIALTDSKGKIKRINDSFSRLFDFREDEIMGKPVDKIIIPKDENVKNREIPLKTTHGEIVSAETKRMKKSGELIDVSILASEVNPASENSDLYLIYRDISERKKVETALQTLLTEKDILLKEVYHRVKNNFQVISSLLNLQAKNISDEETKQTFRDSRNRIHTMALVHEKLYQSQDLSSINLKEYLASLIYSLLRSFQTGSPEIKLKLDIDEIKLSIDHAIPCGLIVNEIFTNAIKYAFPNDFSGKPEIKVTCKKINNTQVRLSICDNGVGIPKNFSLKNSVSLGMRLVHSLVTNQLEGSMEIENKGGTRVNIIFGLGAKRMAT